MAVAAGASTPRKSAVPSSSDRVEERPPMTRSPALLGVTALLLGGVAWWVLAEDPSPDGVSLPSVTRDSDSDEGRPARGPELAVAPRPEIPVGEWRGVGAEVGGVRGQVVDANDAPAAGVTVRLLRSSASGAVAVPGTPAVRTTDQGLFRFEGLTPGWVRLSLEETGRVPLERDVLVPAVDLVLRLAVGRVLEGVVHSADGSGVPEATVHVSLPLSGDFLRASAVTDRDGRFEITRIPYAAVVGASVDAGTRGRARAVKVPWRLGRPVDLVLDPPDLPARVRVVEVAPPAPAQPLAAQRLRWRMPPVTPYDDAAWQEVTTGEDGSIEVLAPAGALVTFETTSLPPGLAPVNVAAWTFVVSEWAPVTDLPVARAAKTRTVGVRGRAIGPDGEPIRNAEVGVVGMVNRSLQRLDDVEVRPWSAHEGGMRRTDAEGRFSFEVTFDPPQRFVAVFVLSPGFVLAARRLPDHPADVLDATLELERAYALVGRVVDERQDPVAGALVTLDPAGEMDGQALQRALAAPRPARTGPDGSFRVEGLARRRYGLVLRSPEGALGTNTLVDVTLQETSIRNLLLRRGGTIVGVVVDADGTPIGNAEVSARSTTGDRMPAHRVWTDAAGRFEIRGLAQGRNEVGAHADGFLRWSGPDMLLPSKDILRITLERGREVRGTVLDARGQPLPGVRVLRNPSPDHDIQGASDVVRTNARGVFVVTGVEPGPQRFAARAPDLLFPEVTWEGLDAGPVLRALAPGVVTGRVLDLQGQPLEGVEVVARPYEVPWRRSSEAFAGRSARTDIAGRFRFEGMIPEAFSVGVVAAGRHFLTVPLASREEMELREIPAPAR
jgi:protocatechuate 3,4-dioxygenase beta subunit